MALPSVAVITQVYNEDVLLPIWRRHYGQHVGAEHLYVIDDGSTDGSAASLTGVNVIRQERKPIDQDIRALTISAFHAEMLRHYDVVIYTDVDELLVVDPLLKLGLVDYIAKHTRGHTAAFGFDVIHNRFEEAEYAADVGVLEQRRFARFARSYCKQLIHSAPVLWTPGFHNSDKPFSVGVGLYLFHFRGLDYELSRKRINRRNRLQWSEQALAKEQGRQNRLVDSEYLQFIYPAAPDEFADAMNENEFNLFVARVGQLLAQRHSSSDKEVRDQERRLLTLPPRFRSTIPAALSSAPEDPMRGTSPLGSAGAQELYDRAARRVIDERWGYA